MCLGLCGHSVVSQIAVLAQALLLKKVFGEKMGQCNGFPMKEVLGCEEVGTNIFESSPIHWEIHMDDGEYYEEGSNNMKLFGGSAKKQKWMMKRTNKHDYQYFDFRKKFGFDKFLGTVTSEEKDMWYPELRLELKKNLECGGIGGDDGIVYFVMEGPKIGLYKNYS